MDRFAENLIKKWKEASLDREKILEITRDALKDPHKFKKLFPYLHEGKDLSTITLKDVIIYRDQNITIARVKIDKGFQFPPHNHRVWAVIGVDQGEEENIFFKKDEEHGLKEVGRKRIRAGEVMSLDKDIIHSMQNAFEGYTYGIHIYGGDFLSNWQERKRWDPDTFEEVSCKDPN